MEELTPEEKAVLQSFRKLDRASKDLLAASKDAFISWLRTDVAWVWNKIAPYIVAIWEGIKQIFGLK